MTLLDDAVVVLAVAVSLASVVILFVSLVRYRKVSEQALKSAELAKNIWDTMNARLTLMDARIIDAMAKVEIYSAKGAPQQQGRVVIPPHRPPLSQPAQTTTVPPAPAGPKMPETAVAPQIPSPGVQPLTVGAGSLERTILSLLLGGPKTNNQIRDLISRSREHTARVMKLLFESGMVTRNDQVRPFVYEITEAGRRYLGS